MNAGAVEEREPDHAGSWVGDTRNCVHQYKSTEEKVVVALLLYL